LFFSELIAEFGFLFESVTSEATVGSAFAKLRLHCKVTDVLAAAEFAIDTINKALANPFDVKYVGGWLSCAVFAVVCCRLLSFAVVCCRLLPFAVYYCVLLCTTVYCCVLLCTTVYYCVLLCTAVYCYIIGMACTCLNLRGTHAFSSFSLPGIGKFVP
jgi:hypothetical protein